MITLVANEGSTACYLKFDNAPSTEEVVKYMDQVGVRPAHSFEVIDDLDRFGRPEGSIICLGSSREQGELLHVLQSFDQSFRTVKMTGKLWSPGWLFAAILK